MLQAIEQLPPQRRAVISLRDLDGWSAQEVCNTLHLETNQRVLLRAPLAKARKALEPGASGGDRPREQNSHAGGIDLSAVGRVVTDNYLEGARCLHHEQASRRTWRCALTARNISRRCGARFRRWAG
ncbi:MAG: hypothetical protein IPG14_10375 [Dehalococcoidia bacterium]|nr:hypothetical protein [Dehalococcoidia bacterium]